MTVDHPVMPDDPPGASLVHSLSLSAYNSHVADSMCSCYMTTLHRQTCYVDPAVQSGVYIEKFGCGRG